MSHDHSIRQALNNPNLTIQTEQAEQKENIQEQAAVQESSADNYQSQTASMTPAGAALRQKNTPLKARRGTVTKMTQSGDKAQQLTPVQRIKNSADEFHNQNQELDPRRLVSLREYIKPGDKKEDILKKVSEYYPDPYLADEALDFLLETTDGELYQEVLAAKEELNKTYKREIAAGQNMGAISRNTAAQGVGTPTSLRDLYRDITGNPRNCTVLFDELSRNYAYKDLQTVIAFLFHSLGADMKSKGPSIEGPMLQRLIIETRSLQAILGVYNFFKSRMPLVQKLFTKNECEVPPQITFEQLAKQFMGFASDRYPSSEKALQIMTKLGIAQLVVPEIIILSQMRDGVREVAVNQIFKSPQHQNEVFLALIDALEDLEDELEELEDQRMKLDDDDKMDIDDDDHKIDIDG